MALGPRAASRLAWSMAGVATVMALAGLGYAIASWHVPLPADIFGFRGFNTIIALELAAMGEEWLWIVAFTMLTIVLAVFPDGHALSRRWRRVLIVGLAGTAVSVIAYVLTDDPSVFRNVENPLAVSGAAAVGNATITFFFVLLVSGVANLIIRFRRSTGDEHEQLKWLATSTCFVVAAFGGYLLGFFIFGAGANDTLAVNIAEGVMIVGPAMGPDSRGWRTVSTRWVGPSRSRGGARRGHADHRIGPSDARDTVTARTRTRSPMSNG